MDFRLNDELEKWTKKSKLLEGGFDIISLAGASKDLAGGSEEVKSNLMKHISISADFHKIERIIIFHHSGCGAYAADYKFISAEEEKEKQLEDMKKSKGIILAKYPEVKMVFVWGELKDEDGKKIEFETIST